MAKLFDLEVENFTETTVALLPEFERISWHGDEKWNIFGDGGKDFITEPLALLLLVTKFLEHN